MSYYDVLGIPFDADEERIRSAYRRLARRYHPDAGGGASVERFRQVVEAYETLSDPGRRKVYDSSVRPVRPGFIRVEPMVAGPRPFVRGPQARTRIVFDGMSHPGLGDLFDEILRSFDDFFVPPFRW